MTSWQVVVLFLSLAAVAIVEARPFGDSVDAPIPGWDKPPDAVPPPETDSGDGTRSLGYKKKDKGPTTPRPTWRPAHIPREVENPAIDVPDENSAEPDELFDPHYYDHYDGGIEGTEKHIKVFHTFEERMKTYMRMVHAIHSPPKTQESAAHGHAKSIGSRSGKSSHRNRSLHSSGVHSTKGREEGPGGLFNGLIGK